MTDQPAFTVEELRAALRLDEPDEDALTIKQMAEMLGCCPQTARNYVARALELGTIRETTVRVPDKRGYKRTVPGYVILKEKE